MKPEFRYYPVTFIPMRWMMDNVLRNKERRVFPLANAGVFLKRRNIPRKKKFIRFDCADWLRFAYLLTALQ